MSDKELQSMQAHLLAEIRYGVYGRSARLPRESVLAVLLNITRTQLRDIPAGLEWEGLIIIRYGVCMIINHHVLNVDVRAYLEVEFMQMISQSGFTPKETVLVVDSRQADAFVAERLSLNTGSAVIFVSRVVAANNKSVIYCEDYIPFSIVNKGSYFDDVFNNPIFDFFKMLLRLSVYGFDGDSYFKD